MGILPADLDILPPSDDRVFKLLFTAPEAKDGLMHLISGIIGRNVTDIALHLNEPPQRDTKKKAERFDINGKLEDGSQMNVEMQSSHMQEDADGRHQNLKGKSVYYLTDLHASQPAKGLRRYDRLSKTYQITFCSYTIFPDTPDYVNTFSLRHDTSGELLTDAIHLTFVELSKAGKLLKKPVSEMTALDKWAVFLRYAPDPKHREAVNEIIESEEVLQVAGELLMNISQNERERAIFRSRRKFQTDMQSDLATAEDRGERRGIEMGMKQGIKQGMKQGMKQGIQQGIGKRNIEIARNLIKMGLPLNQIALATGLSCEEIERLSGEL